MMTTMIIIIVAERRRQITTSSYESGNWLYGIRLLFVALAVGFAQIIHISPL